MVAGTHGKTTSTAMMAHVLHAAGRDPSMLVGGVANDFGSNYRIGAGPDFVIEGDEYDTAFFDKGPKFLHYHARGAIITAVEFDHADIYRDLEHVKSSFRALVDQARILVRARRMRRLSARGRGKCRSARASAELWSARRGISARPISQSAPTARSFRSTRGGKRIVEAVHLPMGGRMNVANALGVYVLLSAFEVPDDEILRGFKSFTGVVRRQQVIGEANGVTVIDDFAHHPTAIRVTLEAIAERFPGPQDTGGLRAALEYRAPQRLSGRSSRRPSTAHRACIWAPSISRRTIRFRLISVSRPTLSPARSAPAARMHWRAIRTIRSSSGCSPTRAPATLRSSCPTARSTD